MNGFLFVTFGLSYMLYKYLFLWVLEQPMSSDTGGLFFPKAINHIFVGLYVEQICLAALFFLARNSHGKPSAVVEGALMVVLIIFTVSSMHNNNNRKVKFSRNRLSSR
jgi:calcium permeable stress-gated cation channel